MSYNLVKLIGGPIETVEGAQRLAVRLFLQIAHHHGEAEARRIFTAHGRKPTKAEIAERKTFHILTRYDMMKVPNVMALARELAEESRTLPIEEQITPRGSKTETTIDHHIRDLLRKRKARIADGTWNGPPWEWGSILEPIG